jgi:hypothetical protein
MKHSPSRRMAPRSAAPPLPDDLVQQLNAGLRSRNADRKRAAMEACLAARAFAAGFCRGADPERACRRHVIGPHHEHWLAGYHAGLRAAEHATQRYLRDQLQPSSTPPDASATATAAIGAIRADVASSTPGPPRARATRTTRAPFSPQLTLF